MSWVIALNIGILLSPAIAFLLVHHVAADDRIWTWPYLNKRWLVAAYLLAIGTFVVFPPVVEFVRGFGQHGPAEDRPEQRPRRSPTAWAAGLAVVLAMAWWFAGPPWHLDRYHRSVEFHEQANLGPLQAVDKGYLPYIGPASTQYGPGSEVLIYELMHRADSFDIVSFREAWAAIDFASTVIVALVAYGCLGLGPAIAVLIVAMLYSPLAFYGTIADGTFAGYYGWGNALRYISPVVVVPSLALLAHRRSGPFVSLTVVALGAFCGLAAWMSQENLSSTAAAVALFLVLLCSTRTIGAGRAAGMVRDLAVGFGLVAIPVLFFYARHDALGEMVRNYVAVPRAVAAGYSNTWWPAGDSARRTFYGAAPLLVALATVTLWTRPWPTLFAPLDRQRSLLLAFIAVQIVCYQVALLRSDVAHLQNTMLAMPFVLVLGARVVPGWLGTTRRGRAIALGAYVLVALAIFPSGRLLASRQILLTPMARFLAGAADGGRSMADPRVAYARMTPIVAQEATSDPNSTLSMRAFLDFATEVHGLVGNRRTYVAPYGGMQTGALYFFADLTPAPYPFDRDTMTVNDEMRARVVEHIRNHPGEYECYIGGSLDAPEAQAFLATHPRAGRYEKMLGADTVYILVDGQNL